MKFLRHGSCMVLLALASSAICYSAPGEWVSLFDGKSFKGWHQLNGWALYEAEDGCIVGTTAEGSPNSFLATQKHYGDFELEFEVKLDPRLNSGVQVRSHSCSEYRKGRVHGYQVEIATNGNAGFTHDEARRGWSSEDRSDPAARAAFKKDQWNRYRVPCEGDSIKTWVNGVPVANVVDSMTPTGFIALQVHGFRGDSPAQARWRNIRIRERTASAAATAPAGKAEVVRRRVSLAKRDAIEVTFIPADNVPPPGFEALFNGRDFTGWKVPEGDGGHWKIIDGVIDYDAQSEARGDKNLWSLRELGDFILRVDWRIKETPYVNPNVPYILPDGTHARDIHGKEIRMALPDSDSGVFLRGSGKNQVNIWCWPIGSGEFYGYRTDRRQPAAVRAAVTPRTQADKPVGQWNRFEITMRGDRVTVVLNSVTVIENAQLPGVAPKGPIALQHHGGKRDGQWVGPPSLLQFKNIFVKELMD